MIAATWITDPAECEIEYRVTVTSIPADPNLISIEDKQDDPTSPEIKISTETSLIYYGGDALNGTYNPGTYEVEVRAWDDVNGDTGEFEVLKIVIEDPCVNADLVIDTSILKFKAVVTLTQFLNYDPLTISWTDSIVSTTATGIEPCGPYVYELVQVETLANSEMDVPLDLDVFPTHDLTSATKTIDVQTNDPTKVGFHIIRVYVYFKNSPSYENYRRSKVEIKEFCEPTQVVKNSAFSPSKITYTISEPSVIFESTLAATWTTVPAVCNVEYRVSLTTAPVDPNLIVIEDKQNDPSSPEIKVKTGASLIYFGGDALTGTYNPGNYEVYIHLWADNEYDTGMFEKLEITIEDPCQMASLSIDSTVFKNISELTLTQYLNYDP